MPLPSDWFTPLPRQEIAIRGLLDRRQAALWAFMGAGKTASTLAALWETHLDMLLEGAVIVAPKTVSLSTWPAEMADWCQFRMFDHAHLATKQGIDRWRAGERIVYLINYDRLPQFWKLLEEAHKRGRIPASHMVFDELSKTKSHKSVRMRPWWKKWHGIWTGAHQGRVWGLTGTPMPNDLTELFGQIRTIDGGRRLGTTWTGFLNRWFDSDYMGWKFTPKQGAREEILQRISDIVIVVPAEGEIPVQIEDIEVTLPDAAMTAYKRMQKDFVLQWRQWRDRKSAEPGEIVAVNEAVLTGKLQQLAGGFLYDENREVAAVHEAKLDALEKLLKRGHLFVATFYQHETDRLLERFPQARMFDVCLIPDWNAGKIPLMIAKPQSAGHGLNLQYGPCSTVVYYTLPWSGDYYEQFFKRIARPGQKKPHVDVVHLIAKGTIDEVILATLRERSSSQRKTVSIMDSLSRLEET
jgi:hypothetical protein